MRLIAAMLSACPVVAQGLAGFQNFAFPNPTGQGSASLTATVWYPATAAGAGAPIVPLAGGHPVVVFLHGLNVIGTGYAALGQRFAEQGYVVVLQNTAASQAMLQVQDGIALFPALQQANAAPGFLQGALDMSRAGLAGHSMGGSTTTGVLASNPGYRAGFAFAPGVAPEAPQVTVPMGVCHGTGDAFLNWQTFGLALYQNLGNVADLRFFYVLNQDCTHGNVAGYVQTTAVDQQVFAASARVAIGFFDRFVRDQPGGLEPAIGAAARAEPRLFRLDVEVRAPQLWLVGSAAPGSTVTARVAAAPGLAGLFAAATESMWPTPFGLALLDPGSLFLVGSGQVGGDALSAFALGIPANPALVGLQLPLQGIAADPSAALRLTGLDRLLVGP